MAAGDKVQYCGVAGKIVVGTHELANMKNVTLNITNEPVEVDKFGNTAVTRKQCAFYDWDGSFDGHWDMASFSGVGQKVLHDAVTGGTTVTLKIYIDTTKYYSGTAYITTNGISGSAAKGDIWKASFNFKASGALTLTLA